jgi:hypothetical protein
MTKFNKKLMVHLIFLNKKLFVYRSDESCYEYILLFYDKTNFFLHETTIIKTMFVKLFKNDSFIFLNDFIFWLSYIQRLVLILVLRISICLIGSNWNLLELISRVSFLKNSELILFNVLVLLVRLFPFRVLDFGVTFNIS